MLQAIRLHRAGNGPAKIITLGSQLSDRAMIFHGPYSASKHPVKAVTDAVFSAAGDQDQARARLRESPANGSHEPGASQRTQNLATGIAKHVVGLCGGGRVAWMGHHGPAPVL